MTWFKDKKVILPVDFSEPSDAAVDTAIQMGVDPRNLFIVHVAPDLVTMSPGVGWAEITDDVRRKNIEQKFHEVFSGPDYAGATFEVLFGDPGFRIAEYVEQVGADAIVMSSHGRTGLKRWVLGSVAERVVRAAPCDVVVLKHR